jgi:O-methyltransferase involved in polyketide biosynthesis
LDGRFWRLDNGQVTWLDLDLPEVVQLRRKFYAESDRNRFIARSILDFTWIDELQRHTGQPLLILIEGVLPYFEEAQVRQLFGEIADRLPGAELVFHTTSPLCVRQQPCSRLFRGFQARFRWGIRSGREIENWDPRYEFLAEWAFVDRHPSRWRWVGWARWLPWLGSYLRATMKVTHFRFRA